MQRSGPMGKVEGSVILPEGTGFLCTPFYEAAFAGGVAERNLPAPLRHAISSESGFNDGLALPFVVLPVLVFTEPPGEVLGHWLTHTVLLEIVAGLVLTIIDNGCCEAYTDG